jgi:hypothetical protein
MTKDPEQSWFEANARILHAAEQVTCERFLTARGEDILSNPETFLLRQVCEWLELEVTPEILAAMRRPGLPPFVSD